MKYDYSFHDFFEGGDISLEKIKENVLPFIIDVCIILKNIVLYSRITEVSTYSIVAKYIKV